MKNLLFGFNSRYLSFIFAMQVSVKSRFEQGIFPLLKAWMNNKSVISNKGIYEKQSISFFMVCVFVGFMFVLYFV